MRIFTSGWIGLSSLLLFIIHLANAKSIRTSRVVGRDIPNLPSTESDVAHLKIVGGNDVTRGRWPWQTLVLVKKRNQATGTVTLCGGTLIAAKWTLTAAHCVENYSKVRIYFGVWNITNRIEAGRESRIARRVIRHPCYDGTMDTAFTASNLALIELSTPMFSFTSACLDRGESHDWKKLTSGNSLGGCVATGYGVTDTGKDAEILQRVEFSTVSMKTCGTYGQTTLSNKILCASDDRVTGKDTCKGDMGGPLVCPTSRSRCGGYYLAGVTLAGSSKCGEVGKPGIYAAVHPNLDWIKSVMRNRTAGMRKQAYNCAIRPTLKGNTPEVKLTDMILRTGEVLTI